MRCSDCGGRRRNPDCFKGWRHNPRISIIKKLGLETQFEEYYNQGLTDEELASLLSDASDAIIQKHHIKAWRKRHGWLANKPKSRIETLDEQIQNLYEQGLQDYEIAEQLGEGRWTIEAWRKEHGVPAHGRHGLLSEEYPEVVAEWHSTLNLPLLPEQFTSGSGKKVWWRCREDPRHLWASTINKRTVFHRPTGCPWCFHERGGRYPTFTEPNDYVKAKAKLVDRYLKTFRGVNANVKKQARAIIINNLNENPKVHGKTIEKLLRQIVESLLEATEQKHEVFSLCKETSLSYSNIAEQIGIPVQTVINWCEEEGSRALRAKISPEKRAFAEHLCKNYDITLSEIAKRTGININTISNICAASGHPRLPHRTKKEKPTSDPSQRLRRFLYRRNPDNRRRRFERSARQGDFRSQVQLLQLRMRSGEIPVDYVRRAAALGDKRAEALGLEPWPVDDSHGYQRFMRSILEVLPETLLVSFAADVAERVLYIFEDEYTEDTRPRDAIEAARRWVEDPSEENVDAARTAADAAHTTDAAVTDIYADHQTATFHAVEAAAWAAYAADTAAAYADIAAAYADTADYSRSYAYFAANAANAAAYAAAYNVYAAYFDHAYAAEEAWQKQRLIKYLLGEIEV